ncbi:MAG TPA: metalloregulator ArsR/SmtB family transcription factor [Desulfomonilaceae bacterium]|nr:metalloregulator ArsR/SmtB family transcription factor [Desulfomonilaceae bacterium]
MTLFDCCPEKPGLKNRQLLSAEQSAELEAIFKVLANQTRLRMLHAVVKAGEICVTSIAELVGMKPQAISNQLQRLLDRGMLAARRSGNNMFYRVIDPCVVSLLDRALCLMEDDRARERLPGSDTLAAQNGEASETSVSAK